MHKFIVITAIFMCVFVCVCVCQAQPTLMTLPGILNQPTAPTLQSQPLLGLQLSSSGATTAAAILTPPTPVCTTPASGAVPKQNQATAPSSAAALKLSQSVLQPIQPRRTSPPIKVPHYTANCHPSAQVSAITYQPPPALSASLQCED